MKDLMIDLETLGLVPGCSIISIGACFFNSEGIGHTFYTTVSAPSCVRWGLLNDPDTEKWWSEQSAEARAYAQPAIDGNAPTLPDALGSFFAFIRENSADPKEVRVWGYGSDFDIACLKVAADRCGSEVPWHYRNARCFRTLRAVFPSVVEPERKGTHHNALDDAIHQALHAVPMLRAIGDGITIQ